MIYDTGANTFTTTTGIAIYNQCYDWNSLDYGDCLVAETLWLENAMSFISSLFLVASQPGMPESTIPANTFTYTSIVTSTFEVDGQKYGITSPTGPPLYGTNEAYTFVDVFDELSLWPPYEQGYTCTTGCGQCTIRNWDLHAVGYQNVDSVRLMYWPNMSAADTVETTAPDQKHASAVLNGTTYISPYAYLSFSVLSAVNSCGLVGKRHTNVVLTLTNPAMLSSISWSFSALYVPWGSTTMTLWSGSALHKSFRYADLDWPYPPSAYSGQQECEPGTGTDPGSCDVIISPYLPTLVIPPEIKTIDPLWTQCDYWSFGAHDPPYALTAVGAATMAETISLSIPTSIAAQPASVAKPQIAPQTVRTSSQTAQARPSMLPQPDPGNGEDEASTGADPKASDPSSWPFPSFHITLGTNTYTGVTQGHLKVGSTIISAGGPAVTSNGQIVRVAADGKVWGGSPSHVSVIGDVGDPRDSHWTPTPTTWVLPQPVMTIGGMTFTRLGASALFAGGQVLSDGASAVVSGTPVRLATSGGSIVIGNQLYGIGLHRDYHENSNDPADGASVTSTPRVISAGGAIYTANADGAYIIHGQTLSRGEKIVDAGTTISLATDGAFALVGSSTQELSPISTDTAHAISFKGQTYIADPDSNFVIDGQTLHPGSRLTISGTMISLATDGSFAIIGSSTQSLSPLPTDPPVITFHGETYTAGSTGAFTINGQTLHPGDKVTISNTVLSLATDDTFALIGTSTQFLYHHHSSNSPPGVLTFAGKTYTADPHGNFIANNNGGQTLHPGDAITISGTIISLASDDAFIVVGSSTQELFSSAQSTDIATAAATTVATGLGGDDDDTGIGGMIMSGFGSPKATDGTGVFFEGGAGKLGIRFGILELGVMMGIVVVVIVVEML